MLSPLGASVIPSSGSIVISIFIANHPTYQWAHSLPSTLERIDFTFGGSLQIWMRPLPAPCDPFLELVCCIDGFVPESMKCRFPLLSSLRLEGRTVTSMPIWNGPMLQQFVDELPPSLTSLCLLSPMFSRARSCMVVVPPPSVLQNLAHFELGFFAAPARSFHRPAIASLDVAF